MSVFLFWSDIRKFVDQNTENQKPSGFTKKLIREDAKLYNSVSEKPRENIPEQADAHAQDKYEEKDKEYLEKLINKH